MCRSEICMCRQVFTSCVNEIWFYYWRPVVSCEWLECPSRERQAPPSGSRRLSFGHHNSKTSLVEYQHCNEVVLCRTHHTTRSSIRVKRENVGLWWWGNDMKAWPFGEPGSPRGDWEVCRLFIPWAWWTSWYICRFYTLSITTVSSSSMIRTS